MLNLESSMAFLFVPGDGADVLWEPNLLLYPDWQLDWGRPHPYDLVKNVGNPKYVL